MRCVPLKEERHEFIRFKCGLGVVTSFWGGQCGEAWRKRNSFPVEKPDEHCLSQVGGVNVMLTACDKLGTLPL